MFSKIEMQDAVDGCCREIHIEQLYFPYIEQLYMLRKLVAHSCRHSCRIEMLVITFQTLHLGGT